MKNIELEPLSELSTWRKVAAVAWDSPYQAAILGQLPVRAEPLEAYIASERERTGQRITLTHCVARAVAVVLRRYPDANAFPRLGGLYRRKQVNVFLQVALQTSERLGKVDLSGVLVREADTLTVSEIAEQVAARAAKLRAGNDQAFQQTKDQMRGMPAFVLRRLLRVLQVVQYEFNLDTSFLGTPGDPFGSALVTSMGMFDVPVAWAPFMPLARTPLIVCIGAVRDEPVVQDGEVVAGRVFRLQATIDHRVLDGVQAARLSQGIATLLANPETLNDTP
ncbi:MAG: pyruvate/2-oxoglutarate dehydrogenase complex dihydrolipoamide acyltransferase (E2) component [Myxococcota bacterium]|jgi:pyruvate/2-oxoglutarate dehydrogenase complex dihydrolipoamide acyltransferase (E2) component